jgi:hypothetical protein
MLAVKLHRGKKRAKTKQDQETNAIIGMWRLKLNITLYGIKLKKREWQQLRSLGKLGSSTELSRRSGKPSPLKHRNLTFQWTTTDICNELSPGNLSPKDKKVCVYQRDTKRRTKQTELNPKNQRGDNLCNLRFVPPLERLKLTDKKQLTKGNQWKSRTILWQWHSFGKEGESDVGGKQ